MKQFKLNLCKGHALINDGENIILIDTGAQNSYLSDNLTRNYESIGNEEDFYPEVGKFETKCFEIATSLGDCDFIAKYGNLPSALQNALMSYGSDGIIGFDFFNNFKVLLDLKNNKLKFSKNGVQ